MEDEVQQALKAVGTEKSPGINDLPYEAYSRLSHMFAILLTTISNNCMKQSSIP